MNLDKSYKNFFRDKPVGFLKLKGKKTNNQKGTTYIKNNHIIIPKLKSIIKIKQHKEFVGLTKSCTIQ